MRRLILLFGVTVGIATAVACASSEEQPKAAESDAGPSTPILEAGPRPDEDVDSAVSPPTCSDAGWCITSMPDIDLVFKDVWVFPTRAFAIAESPTVGVKVLEWEDSRASWQYIDDATQNEPGYGEYAGAIWAASENEVFYAVSKGTIYHGIRESTAGPWTWARQSLPDNAPDVGTNHDHGHPYYQQLVANNRPTQYPALGVWGTGPNEVYAWYSNTVFRWSRVDGGPPAWIADYVADDVDDPFEHFYVLSVNGKSADDVWVSLARDRYWGACAVVLHKTPSAYERVADGVVQGDNTCTPRDGISMVGGAEGWITDLQIEGPNRVVGLKGTRDAVRLEMDGDGGLTTAVSTVPRTVSQQPLWSFWAGQGGQEGQRWLTGWGMVVREKGGDPWDGGTFTLSTISLNGAPLDRPMYRIRGSSNENLWAMGFRNALHKTTP
ncbi:hypothetical protein AKJ09_00903 [Labilithrix luteola]|uniref:Uncharacterized protein n=1 Tax=Labilithrix luteola TaxID=1391654 RepID=A0A0K1PMC4_9BACT|nr:hypothetical protein [Labilithrix luteola]AKU94239.1 hypothetical protein AKJ09_00903 [Labilithrix luteola]